MALLSSDIEQFKSRAVVLKDELASLQSSWSFCRSRTDDVRIRFDRSMLSIEKSDLIKESITIELPSILATLHATVSSSLVE